MSKIYVKVDATFEIDGSIVPKYMYWQDGRKFEVQKILDVRRAASLKAGGTGLRYTCKIEGYQRYLFLEDCIKANSVFGAKWFVEGKDK